MAALEDDLRTADGVHAQTQNALRDANDEIRLLETNLDGMRKKLTSRPVITMPSLRQVRARNGKGVIADLRRGGGGGRAQAVEAKIQETEAQLSEVLQVRLERDSQLRRVLMKKQLRLGSNATKRLPM